MRQTARSWQSHRRSGAAVVEVALLMTVFLLFLFGTFEYCRYLLMLHVATNAARDGARFASVNVNNPAFTGTAITTTPYSTGQPAYTVPDITNRVRSRMGGIDTMIENFQVHVFPCNSSLLYDDPPQFVPRTGSRGWNDAQFGERIAVRIRGTYRPVVPNLLMLPTQLPINLTVVMGSEG